MIDENINRDGYTLEDITAPRYKIGDLARIFDVTTETIRYYERIGIIKAYRSESGTRYFDATSVITIFLLRYKQVCGFENYEIVNQQRKSTLKEMEEAIIRKKEQLEREKQQEKAQKNKTKKEKNKKRH